MPEARLYQRRRNARAAVASKRPLSSALSQAVCLPLVLALISATVAFGQEAGFNDARDAESLLDEAERIAAPKSRQLLRKALHLVQTSKLLSRRDRDATIARLIAILPEKAKTQAQVVEALGKPASTSRQVYFGSYLECWSYAGAPGLLVVFECPKGRTPRLRKVRQMD